MQINNIQFGKFNSPSFGALNITEKGQQLIDKTFNKAQLQQIEVYKQELENTKNFDLEIDAVGDSLSYGIEHKTNPRRYDSEGPLFARSAKDNSRILAYGIDWLDCGDTVPYYVKFASDSEAAQAYSKLKMYERLCGKPIQKNDFKTVAWAVESVKMLDEHNDHEYNCKHVNVLY